MLKYFIILFIFPFLCHAQSLSGSATVSASNTSSSTLYNLITTGSGGSDSASAIKTYIPMGSTFNSGTAADQSPSYYINGSGNIPEFDTGYSSSSRIRHSVTVDNSSNSSIVYLYAAVVDKDDSSNMAVFSGGLYSGSGSGTGQLATINAFANNEITFDLYINNLCYAVADSSSTNCNNLDDNAGVTATALDLTVIIFATSDNLSRFTQVAVSTYDPAGVYYNYKLSNQISTLADAEVILSRLRKGDGRVTAEYSGPVISEFHDVIGYKHDGAGNTVATAINDGLTGSVISEDNGAKESDEIVVKGLENDVAVNISVGFVNRWNFVTKLSPSLTQTPESIEVFLEKQSCYLFSAGFQEEHFILDYFRNFRDRVLLKTELGERFVEFYYATAPEYAPYIYKSNTLSFIMRVLAYGIYWIMQYFWIILFFIFALLLMKIKKLYSRLESKYN
ncbi:MAG: CFI-box-CTERM domain-containing protein [Bacteriovoracaceae bacterium]